MKKIMHRQIRFIKNWVVLLNDHVSFPVLLATVSPAQHDLNNADAGDCMTRSHTPVFSLLSHCFVLITPVISDFQGFQKGCI